jgi:hypothetical protein
LLSAVTERFDPLNTRQVLLAAGKHLVDAGRPLLYADSGVEKVNGEVNATLFSACLDRILAQVEVGFSNSIVEAFWRSPKHQWLFLNSLDTVARSCAGQILSHRAQHEDATLCIWRADAGRDVLRNRHEGAGRAGASDDQCAGSAHGRQSRDILRALPRAPSSPNPNFTLRCDFTPVAIANMK